MQLRKMLKIWRLELRLRRAEKELHKMALFYHWQQAIFPRPNSEWATFKTWVTSCKEIIDETKEELRLLRGNPVQ